MDSIQHQYEKHPYPPIPWIALPRRDQGDRLRTVKGLSPQRILILGCGTFEPTVVAQTWPDCEHLVALDISDASLRSARRRARWARLTRRLAPIQWVNDDFTTWAPRLLEDPAQRFDLILASNVLHHLKDPALALRSCAKLLCEGGWIRLTTYPRQSRHWMRLTAQYFREQGLLPDHPRLLAACNEAIARLPSSDPRRSCFESHPEIHSVSSLIDAFFNARENPLRPLEWQAAAASAGLALKREDQDSGSRSEWLTQLVPETRDLDAWTRLEILDLLLELCANPILWLQKESASVPSSPMPLPREFTLTQGVAEAARLLAPVGVPIRAVIDALARETGPRVSGPPEFRPLPGLSILDHPESWG